MDNEPTYAIKVLDNSMGDGDIYFTFAYIKNGEFYHHDNDQPVLSHKGDELISVWKLT